MVERLFGTAGIRGEFNKELSATLAAEIARALTRDATEGRAVTAMDCRRQAPVIRFALHSGLLCQRWDVYDLGVQPTPVLAYATREKSCNYGLMITASHNPSQDIGIKVFGSGGMELPSDQEDVIQRRLEQEDFPSFSWSSCGSVIQHSGSADRYVRKVIEHSQLQGQRSLDMVVDCCNGPVTHIISDIISRSLHTGILLNSHRDGSFPGRPAEPTPENLRDTASVVKELGVDLTLAFDGDGDRFTVLDEAGRVVDVHTVAATYIKHRIRETGETDVVASVDSSRSISDVVEQEGGRIYETKLGKTFVAVQEHDALVGTEPWKIVDSGWGSWEDGIFAAVKIIEWLSATELATSEFFAEVPKYPHLRRSFHVASKEEARTKMEDIVGQLGTDAYDRVDIDGVKMLFDENTWLLVRVSGTENKLRLYVESDTEDKLKELFSRAVEAGNL